MALKLQCKLVQYLRLLFLASALISARAIQIDDDGGYTEIVVKISESVPEDSCSLVLANIKKLFTESSHALYEATQGRAFFKSATVVIPANWRDGKCQTVVREPNGTSPYRVADFRIDNAKHPIYGEVPYTQQSKGCGQPGDFTVLPFKFLTDWNETWSLYGDPSKLVVHEWAKLRYGVYDERGYPDDPLFPNYYVLTNGKVLPTGSANEQVNGRWLDSDKKVCDPRNSPNCEFTPEGDNSHLTCSLGYLYFLPSVKTFCDRYSGLPLAPTKHNILCNGKSSAEVIDAHEDFQHRFPESSTNKRNVRHQERVRIEPEISVVRNPSEKFILVIETSASMDHHGQWKWINKAAQKFIRYDIPNQSHMAIVTFSNTSRVEHPMAQISSDDIRSRLADTIPDRYHLSRSEVKCLLCGVQKSIHDVLRNNMAGAHLVFITRGSSDTLSISDEKTILEYVRFYHLTVSSIVVPENKKTPLAFYDSIAQASGGISRIITNDDHFDQASVKTYVDLMSAFYQLLPKSGPAAPAVIVHQSFVKLDQFLSTSGSFVVDETLGRETRFGIYVHDEEDHLIRSVSFTDSRSMTYGPYTSMSSFFDIVNLKTVNYPVGEAPPFDDPELLGTQWTYKIDWYSGGKNYQRSAVQVSSRPRYGDDDITVEVWTNAEGAADHVTGSRPLAVYTQIIKGSSPVLRADVTLEIRVTLSNHSDIVDTIKLYDNGKGDADLVAGDGIYSRFVTTYHGQGRYSFTVKVNDGAGSSFTVRTTRDVLEMGEGPNLSPCCGSIVNIDKVDRIPTGRFSRSVSGPVVHLLSVPTKIDQMPPARIIDFRLEVLADSSQVLATWTAPGDDFDVGTLSGYRIIVSDNISALIDPDNIKETLIAFNQADEAGQQTSFQFSIVAAVVSAASYLNKDIYVAIVGFDDENNEGKLSNIVSLHLDGSAYPEVPGVHPVSAQPEEALDQTVVIGAACGSFAVVALCALVAFIYRRQTRVSTKSGGVTANLVNGDLETSTENAEADSKLANSQLTMIAPIPRPPLNDDDGSTPIYWSASQLLAHQEAVAAANNNPDPKFPPQLDTIREEYTDEVDEEVYARGLANYGYHVSQHLSAVTSTPTWRGYPEDHILMSDSLLANTTSRIYGQHAVHEPVYTGYSPDVSIYSTNTISRASKVPPRIPPKPSINALLGIGDSPQPIYVSQNQLEDLYGSAAKRNITHV